MDFDKLYLEMMKGTEISNRPPSIRPSSVPFCPKMFIFQYIEFIDGGGSWDFFGDFYTGIGTVIHNIIQKWLPIQNPGYIMGNWKCRCGNTVKNRVGPVKCKKCKIFMEYQEIVVKFPDAKITGHIDGLIINYQGEENINKIIRDFSRERIPAWILELKSTGMYAAKNIKVARHNHDCQATIYTQAMKKVFEKKFNLEIKGYIIKYIARDHPGIRSIDIKKKINDDRLYKITCKLFNIFNRSLSTKNIDKLFSIKPCKRWPEIYQECEYAGICADLKKSEFKKDFGRVCEKFRV